MTITDQPDVLAILTARGGSKGIPGKNTRLLAGLPLIAWTIKAALTSSSITRLIVSTDDSEIARIATEYGAECPFVRPAELAKDDTPGIAPFIHAINHLKSTESYEADYSILLQPTSPLRTADDLDRAIALIQEKNGQNLVSVCPVREHPLYCMKIDDNGIAENFMDIDLSELNQRYPRRQDLPPAYIENGAIYICKTAEFLVQPDFYNPRPLVYIMTAERSIDIDTEEDFLLAENRLSIMKQT